MSDPTRWLVLVGLWVALAAVIILWRRFRLGQLSRARLAEPEQPGAKVEPPRARPFVRRHLLVPWVLALFLGGALYLVVKLPPVFAGTFALVAGLLGGQAESFRATRLTLRIEQQLADAIDLMVAALRAGAGVVSGLESAARESRRPLKPQLEELLGRIRYGDDPQEALGALYERVPLETFRLFTSALSVHWETGGSLAPTLATIGRVIRDRIEVQRRIRSLTAQARTSTVAVLVVTYFLALLIWRNDPERMQKFLATTAGRALAAGAILLQAVGIIWSAALTRLKY